MLKKICELKKINNDKEKYHFNHIFPLTNQNNLKKNVLRRGKVYFYT